MNNVVRVETDKQMVARQVEALRSEKVKLYSLDEAEKILDEVITRHEELIKNKKDIIKSEKEEYPLLDGSSND